MTLIERQDTLVAELERLYQRHFSDGKPAFMQHTVGLRARAKRVHREQLIAAGYSAREAMESADQCDHVAYRNADHAHLLGQLGVAA